MSTYRLSIAVLLSLFASATLVPAMGDQAVVAVTSSGDGRSNSETGGVTIDRELNLFRAAEVSLREAMAIAEKLRRGARVVDISFDGGPSSPVYRVITLENHQIWKGTIDANTGELQENGIASSLEDLNAEDRNNLGALNFIRQDLLDAVLVAEKSTSGKAVSGGLTSERGKLKFVVTVLSDDDLKEVILEPPQALRQGAALRRRR